eukprot:3278968-Alexandrium_andersonii.AAC.1
MSAIARQGDSTHADVLQAILQYTPPHPTPPHPTPRHGTRWHTSTRARPTKAKQRTKDGRLQPAVGAMTSGA